MTRPTFDITPYLSRSEGAHFDRKSLWAGPPGSKGPRDRKTVRDQIAAYVAAFANAEGGVLLLGVEDDGAITGHATRSGSATRPCRRALSTSKP